MPVLKVRDPNTGQYVPLLGGGVTDHGALTGLGDDDHPQYVKDIGDSMTGTLDVLADARPGVSIRGNGASFTTRPELRLKKLDGGANSKTWGVYVSGGANDIGSGASSLTVSSFDDDDVTVSNPLFRFLRNGRFVLGADGTTGLEAVAYEQIDPGSTYGWAAASGWTAYGAGYTGLLETRIGGITVIEGTLKRTTNLSITAGTMYQIGTIGSASWRPPNSIVFIAGLELTASSLTAAIVYVQSDGVINMRPMASGTVNTGMGIAINGAWRTN